jgi:hypothetical protein
MIGYQRGLRFRPSSENLANAASSVKSTQTITTSSTPGCLAAIATQRRELRRKFGSMV